MADYAGTIFSNPLAVEAILPFLLVFVLVFAVLQKTEVLGKGKKQIDALIALVVGLIVISFGYAVYIINNLIPFLAVSLVIILVFMLLVGSFFEAGKFELGKNVKIGAGIVALIALVIAVLYITGYWDTLVATFGNEGESSRLWANILFIGVIVAVVIAFGFAGKEGKSKDN